MSSYYFRLLLTLFLTVGARDIWAQGPPPPPLPTTLIPYNDHGTWGYCDTLGKLQIAPAYEAAGAFFQKMWGAERANVARVETKWGENLVNTAGELLLPKKANYVQDISSETYPNELFLIEVKGRLGVYHRELGMVVTPKYVRQANDYRSTDWVFLQRKKAETFELFDPETLKMEASDVVAVGSYYGRSGLLEVATTIDGQKHALRGAEMIPLEMEKFEEQYDPMDEVAFEYEEVPEAWTNSYSWHGELPSAITLGVDEALEYKDYTAFGLEGKYGFEYLVLARKGSQMGMVNAKGEVIVPFEYDEVSFSLTNTQAILKKDGKVGRKILFTHHPTIVPRYDELRMAYQLQVKPGWSFAVFQVKLGGQKGYVGENAVEYFEW